MQVRHAATLILVDLLKGKGSLSSLLPQFSPKIADNDRALLQELCFGTCRFQPQLSLILTKLLEKPLRAKDKDVEALLLLGLYQLEHTRIPDHAALGETVEVARSLKKPWAVQLANGVLREFQRNGREIAENLEKSQQYRHNLPEFLAGMLTKAWPESFPDIVAAQDAHPPFCLRLNIRKAPRDEYLQQLRSLNLAAEPTPYSAYGLRLAKPVDVRGLPGFAEGWLSVQDEAAQLCVDLLQLSPKLRVLDACCAPGGKTGHLLEVEPSLDVTALDIEERRLVRVRENLARLGVQAKVRCGDASQPNDWWDGERYDRILLDAPCSATGIIRRHPDIKLLRTPENIADLVAIQQNILQNLWPLLKPGGYLLYATCSILPRENTKQIEAFLKAQSDAEHHPINVDWGLPQTAGRQLFPQINGHDGFYYALLRKLPNTNELN